MHDADRRFALAFAIAHEIGNHLAGIRLEAHLLDEALGARGLAKASLAIDSLAGQAAPLLALLRPLLSPGARRAGGGTLASVLDGVRRQLEEEGAAGHPLAVAVGAGVEGAVSPIEGLHALIVALVGPPEALASGAAPIALRVERAGGALVLSIGLPGEAFVEAAAEAAAAEGAGGAGTGSRGAALRGRALALALARVLVADAGGAVEVGGGEGRSWVALRLPG
ncbi:MAG: hypothetical protein U0900_08585 [Myxococcota bacterium]